jgi:hypothetical protein
MHEVCLARIEEQVSEKSSTVFTHRYAFSQFISLRILRVHYAIVVESGSFLKVGEYFLS